jgi:hypothetical protein
MRRRLVPLKGLCLSRLLSEAVPFMPNCIVIHRVGARACARPWLGAFN